MADSANDELADAVVQHAVDLQRLSADQVARVLGQLDDLAVELAAKLRKGGGTALQQQRTKALLAQLAATVDERYTGIAADNIRNLARLAGVESTFAAASLDKAIGVPLATTALSEHQLAAVADNALIEGRRVKEWWAAQGDSYRAVLQREITNGFLSGEGVEQITDRLVGTKDKPGAFTGARHQAEALVRTSIQQVSNDARLATYRHNGDVVKYLQHHSTLDSKTSDICKARDGLLYTLDGEPVGHDKPFQGGVPYHWNCRSTFISVLKSWEELGAAPIAVGQQEASFEEHFRRRLKKRGFSKERAEAAIADARSSLDGAVPSTQTFEDWLRKKEKQQPGWTVANGVLTPGKFRLWQEGKISFPDLIDQRGNPLSLDELEELVRQRAARTAEEAEAARKAAEAAEAARRAREAEEAAEAARRAAEEARRQAEEAQRRAEETARKGAAPEPPERWSYTEEQGKRLLDPARFLGAYGGEAYRPINQYLRGFLGGADDDYKAFLQTKVDEIDQAFAEIGRELPEGTVLYRGGRRFDPGTYEDPAFLSTSLSKEIADGFTGNLPAGKGATYTIKVRGKGVRGIYMDRLEQAKTGRTDGYWEREILVARGQRVVLTGRQLEDGSWEGFLEAALPAREEAAAGGLGLKTGVAADLGTVARLMGALQSAGIKKGDLLALRKAAGDAPEDQVRALLAAARDAPPRVKSNLARMDAWNELVETPAAWREGGGGRKVVQPEPPPEPPAEPEPPPPPPRKAEPGEMVLKQGGRPSFSAVDHLTHAMEAAGFDRDEMFEAMQRAGLDPQANMEALLRIANQGTAEQKRILAADGTWLTWVDVGGIKPAEAKGPAKRKGPSEAELRRFMLDGVQHDARNAEHRKTKKIIDAFYQRVPAADLAVIYDKNVLAGGTVVGRGMTIETEVAKGTRAAGHFSPQQRHIVLDEGRDRNKDKVIAHEFGHAVDLALGGGRIWATASFTEKGRTLHQILADEVAKLPAATQTKFKRDAAYFMQNPQEVFADTYATFRQPGTQFAYFYDADWMRRNLPRTVAAVSKILEDAGLPAL